MESKDLKLIKYRTSLLKIVEESTEDLDKDEELHIINPDKVNVATVQEAMDVEMDSCTLEEELPILIPVIDAPCRFYLFPGSCRNSDSCKYFHYHPDHRRNWANYPEKLKLRESGVAVKLMLEKAMKKQRTEVSTLSVMQDMKSWEDKKIWPFSVYGQEGEKCIDNFQDKSFEEIRWEMMQGKAGKLNALKTTCNTPSSLVNQYVRVVQWRRLIGASKLEASNLVMISLGMKPFEDEFDPKLGHLSYGKIENMSKDEIYTELNSLIFGALVVPPVTPLALEWQPFKPRRKIFIPNPSAFRWSRPGLLKKVFVKKFQVKALEFKENQCPEDEKKNINTKTEK